MNERSCFSCRNYHPALPDDWKPAYEGDSFNWHTLRGYLMRNHLMPHPENGWRGKCSADPVPVDVRSVHLCGRYDVNDAAILGWDWLMVNRDLQIQNTRLQAELKAARKLASERYQKLRGTKVKKTGGKDVVHDHSGNGMAVRGDAAG